MAEERVIVETKLGVEREQPPVSRGDKRIDLAQRSVGVHKGFVEPRHEADGFINMLRLQAQAECQLARMKRLEAGHGIDLHFQNRVWIFGRDFLDLHAAGSRRHEHRLRRHAIDYDSQIKFALNRQRLFNQQALNDLAFSPGLVRDQPHAQNLVGPHPGFVQVLRDLNAAALAASAGVDLRLDHHALCAFREQLVRRFFSLFARKRHLAARHSHAILRQDCFCLVLVNFHERLGSA